MNKETIEKYKNLGWKFEELYGGCTYFKSPRMNEMYLLCFKEDINSVKEDEMIKKEYRVILEQMENELLEQFDKIAHDIIEQQRQLVERGVEPEKKIHVSFDVEFK